MGLQTETDSPPAERVGSGCPPEGGVDVGKAPLGLVYILNRSLNLNAVFQFSLAHGCIFLWLLHPDQLC